MWLTANPIRSDSKTLSSLPSTVHWAASHAGRFRHAFRTLMIGCGGIGVWVHNHSNMGIDPSCKASLSGCLQHAALGGDCNRLSAFSTVKSQASNRRLRQGLKKKGAKGGVRSTTFFKKSRRVTVVICGTKDMPGGLDIDPVDLFSKFVAVVLWWFLWVQPVGSHCRINFTGSCQPFGLSVQKAKHLPVFFFGVSSLKTGLSSRSAPIFGRSENSTIKHCGHWMLLLYPGESTACNRKRRLGDACGTRSGGESCDTDWPATYSKPMKGD